jgi:hypothetical protein
MHILPDCHRLTAVCDSDDVRPGGPGHVGAASFAANRSRVDTGRSASDAAPARGVAPRCLSPLRSGVSGKAHERVHDSFTEHELGRTRGLTRGRARSGHARDESVTARSGSAVLRPKAPGREVDQGLRRRRRPVGRRAAEAATGGRGRGRGGRAAPSSQEPSRPSGAACEEAGNARPPLTSCSQAGHRPRPDSSCGLGITSRA